MAEYRLAHVVLTCGTLFLLIKSLMVALYAAAGLIDYALFRVWTPLGVDIQSHRLWIGFTIGLLLLREPLLRVLFRARPDPTPAPDLTTLYAIGGRTLGIGILIAFVPHAVSGKPFTGQSHAVDGIHFWHAQLADVVLCTVALLGIVWPRPFAYAASLGARRSDDGGAT